VTLADDHYMRGERSDVPGWIPAVLGGVLFGVVMGAFTKHDGASRTAAGIGALVTGVPFGAAMGWWGTRWQQRMKDAEGDLPDEKVRLAHRAALSGPVPEDVEIRAAALRIASGYLADYAGRTRWLFIVVPALLLIGSVAGAVSESPWGLFAAIVPAAILYTRWYWPRRLRRRIRWLTEAAPETAQ
jgi:Flp pilus assembly protein TadB